MKLQQLNGSSFVYIPKEYVKWKGWKKGEELVIGFNERNNLEIVEATTQSSAAKKVAPKGGAHTAKKRAGVKT